MLDIVNELQNKKDELEDDMRKIDSEIGELSDAYDSLLLFKKSANVRNLFRICKYFLNFVLFFLFLTHK